jgi:hypothetical protein
MEQLMVTGSFWELQMHDRAKCFSLVQAFLV